nr:unnamed protein product [Callosobruchus analis]
MKRQYIASHVQQEDIKRRRERNNLREGKRQYTNKYTFEVNGRQIIVCRKFFLSTLCISQQSVDTAIKKKREGGIVSPDKRGRHVPANKTSPEIRESVRNHILQFPVYQSHYSRERTRKKYLGKHLNISRMYQLYVEQCKDKSIPAEDIAKEWVYSDVFNYEFNYGFKNPDNDTCDDCDMFQLKLREAETEEIRLSVQNDYDTHLRDAGDRYKSKAADKDHSRQCETQKVVMIDLQKCLPTPELTNSQSFYCLKLWTYNLVIHDSTIQKAYCMMWDESIAGRGGNEVASCVLKWAEICNIPETVRDLIIWSDNCPSQNRNFHMVMCYFYLLKIKPNLKTVSHKFLTKGHTHLEADVDHSLIERERKKIPQLKIVTPWDWQQVVRLCGTKKGGFDVIGMETEDFLSFRSLYEGSKSPFVIRKKGDSGETFLLSQAVQLQVRQDQPGILFYKTKFNEDFSSCTLNRNIRKNNVQIPGSLPTIRCGSRKISTKKYNHLQKLTKWIPKQFHKYYQDIPHGEETDEEND